MRLADVPDFTLNAATLFDSFPTLLRQELDNIASDFNVNFGTNYSVRMDTIPNLQTKLMLLVDDQTGRQTRPIDINSLFVRAISNKDIFPILKEAARDVAFELYCTRNNDKEYDLPEKLVETATETAEPAEPEKEYALLDAVECSVISEDDIDSFIFTIPADKYSLSFNTPTETMDGNVLPLALTPQHFEQSGFTEDELREAAIKNTGKHFSIESTGETSTYSVKYNGKCFPSTSTILLFPDKLDALARKENSDLYILAHPKLDQTYVLSSNEYMPEDCLESLVNNVKNDSSMKPSEGRLYIYNKDDKAITLYNDVATKIQEMEKPAVKKFFHR